MHVTGSKSVILMQKSQFFQSFKYVHNWGNAYQRVFQLQWGEIPRSTPKIPISQHWCLNPKILGQIPRNGITGEERVLRTLTTERGVKRDRTATGIENHLRLCVLLHNRGARLVAYLCLLSSSVRRLLGDVGRGFTYIHHSCAHILLSIWSHMQFYR